MEGGSLFNPGFLGSSFHWFIGQIADDSTWRENQNPAKFNKVEDIPAWGYRYKVRIIGQHEQEESDVSAEELPWAQVMYPVTSGNGIGGSFMTPALKQGMFVFGFFLDGKDEQTPIIMGVLGNNAKTKLERKMGTKGSGGKNFTPQSFHSKSLNPEPNEQKKLADKDFAPKQAGNEAYSSSSKSNVSKEASDANNLYDISDERKKYVLEEPHALACPNPDTQTDAKNMQTVIQKLTEKIERFQQSLLDADKAGGLPVLEINKDIDAAIESASEEMSKYMKGMMNQVQQFTTKEFNEKLASLENLAPPSHTLELLNKKVEGLEKIACMFNGMAGLALAGLIAAALKKAFNRKKKKAEDTAARTSASEAGVVGVSSSLVIPSVPTLDTPGSNDVPPPSPDGFYRPTPICETEEIIGEVLGGTINTILQGFDSAIGPAIDEVQNALGGSSTDAGSENIGTIDNSISEDTVLASLNSGDLMLSLSQTVGEAAGINPNTVGAANRYWASGNISGGIQSFITAVGIATIGDQEQIINPAFSNINNGFEVSPNFNILSPFINGVDENILTGVGDALHSIRTGDLPKLVVDAGRLASFIPRVQNAILKNGAASAGAVPSGIGLGALGGMNFDLATALGFVNSITKIFDCDPKPECSPNDSHTMQNGGGSSDKPNNSSVAESAKEKANSSESRKSYGTSVEKSVASRDGVTIKKTFAKPQSRVKDLTNLVGYVNGQPYYGPFHVHVRDDGSQVRMVGIAHTTTSHDIIYDTAQESLQ